MSKYIFYLLFCLSFFFRKEQQLREDILVFDRSAMFIYLSCDQQRLGSLATT